MFIVLRNNRLWKNKTQVVIEQNYLSKHREQYIYGLGYLLNYNVIIIDTILVYIQQDDLHIFQMIDSTQHLQIYL